MNLHIAPVLTGWPLYTVLSPQTILPMDVGLRTFDSTAFKLNETLLQMGPSHPQALLTHRLPLTSSGPADASSVLSPPHPFSPLNSWGQLPTLLRPYFESQVSFC